MLPLYSNDDDVVMSDDQYDESLDKDFEPDSESGESNDDHDDLDGYSSHGALLSSETSSRSPDLYCEHQQIVYLGSRFLSIDALDLYKRRRLSFTSIHRSRYEDLCRCCDSLGIPNETAKVALFLYDCMWKRGTYIFCNDVQSKAAMSAALLVACNKYKFPISPKAIRYQFNSDPDLFTHAHLHLQPRLHLLMTDYDKWNRKGYPKKLLKWRMDDKRLNYDSPQLLDRAQNMHICETFKFIYMGYNRITAAGFRNELLRYEELERSQNPGFQISQYPKDLFYIP